MSPASIHFHDLVLRPHGAGLALLEPLLGHFSAAPASAQPAATLPIELDACARPQPPPLGDRLAAFAQAALYKSSRGFVVTDGTSWVEASTAPPAVRGELAPTGHAKEVAYTALLVALRSLGLYELHAAAVQAPRSTILVIGESGSGKSTLATALLEAGCGYLGDDRVLLRHRNDVLEILSFPAAFRLTETTASAFPRLAPWLSDTRPKRELDLRAAFPGKHVAAAAAPRIVLFPVRNRATSLVSLTASAALTGLLAQSSSLVLPDHPAADRQLEALNALAGSALAMKALLGPEWLQAPVEAARDLLARCEALCAGTQEAAAGLSTA